MGHRVQLGFRSTTSTIQAGPGVRGTAVEHQPRTSPRTGLATLAILSATAVWGATFVTVKDALAQADAFTFLALRFAVGAATAWALSLAVREPRTASVTRAGVTLGLLLFGGYLLQTLGLERSTPARSAFITGITVIFVPFVAWRLERKRPPLRAFLAPLVALFGLQQLTGVQLGDALPPGDLFTLGCAVLYAFHIALMGRLAKGAPILRLTALQLLVVAVLSTACLPFVSRRLEPSASLWFGIFFTGVVASAVAIAAQAWSQTQLSAVRAAVIYSLEPVFAVLTAVAVGQGAPSASEVAGGALILLAVLISELPLEAVLRATRARGSTG